MTRISRGKLLARFWSKVQIKNNKCWIWRGGIYQNGYGVYRGYSAHRLAYRLIFGKFDPTLFVCHRCDNPPCVNPQHLFLGTRQDNINDMVRKKRCNHAGSHNGRATLTHALVSEMRKMYLTKPAREIARQYKIPASTVYYAVSGKTWKTEVPTITEGLAEDFE